MSVVDCLQHISSYFNKGPIKIDPKNPCLKSDGKKIHGFSTIVKYLCSKSTKCDLLGKTAEDQAVVGQWLEYVATVFQRSPKSDMEETFDNINTFLTDRVYLAGFHLTIADIVLYVALYKIIDNLTFQEKQHYMHISRWFNQVQQDPEVRQKNSETPTELISHILALIIGYSVKGWLLVSVTLDSLDLLLQVPSEN